MKQILEAVYVNGVFKPLDVLELTEGKCDRLENQAPAIYFATFVVNPIHSWIR